MNSEKSLFDGTAGCSYAPWARCVVGRAASFEALARDNAVLRLAHCY
jgi:hypothetical protein